MRHDFLEQLLAVAHAHDQRVDAAQHGIQAVQPKYLVFRRLALGDVAHDPDDEPARAGPVRMSPDFHEHAGAVVAHQRYFLQ